MSYTYNSGFGRDTPTMSPNGMKASWRVCWLTLLSRPPTKTVAFCLDWSDMFIAVEIDVQA